MNKEGYCGQLQSVWARAAKELSEALEIYVVGYSYPRSDAFFRYLYALGTVGGPVLRKFWVFDAAPDRGEVD